MFLTIRQHAGNRPRTTRVLNVFGTFGHVEEVPRRMASRAPQVDLKHQRILVVGLVSNTPLTEVLRDAGKPGGNAPDAMKCSGSRRIFVLSKYTRLPVRTFTAPTETRMSPSLMRSKSANFSSVSFSSAVS